VLRAYFSHHKAASSWVKRILFELGTVLGLDVRHLDVPSSYAPHRAVAEMIAAEAPDIIIRNDQPPGQLDELPPLRGFRVIRDPRDVVVSAYYSHRNSHPVHWRDYEWSELVEHRQVLRELDEHAGLLREIEFSGPRFIDVLAQWNREPRNLLVVRMEDLVKNPVAWWGQILMHLDLLDHGRRGGALALQRAKWNLVGRPHAPETWSTSFPRRYARLPRLRISRLPLSYIPWTVARNSFAALSGGREPGDENPHHHYRRGVPGNWRDHFTAEHLAAFRMRFGDLAEQLGYEP
jgi:hypothetical protein